MTARAEDGGDLLPEPRIETISAVTLATRDMAQAFRFYSALGFRLQYGSADAAFTSFQLESGYLNLVASEAHHGWWGRIILYVSDVDAMYRRAIEAGLPPEFAPLDASWGERYFHIVDPDGHELSFARPLAHPGA